MPVKSDAPDPLSDEDRDRDKERAATFWTVATVLYLVITVAHPPTVALGAVAGVAVVAVVLVATVIYVIRLRAAGTEASQGSIFAAAIVGAVSIGIGQWLAGGSESPLQLLFTLTVFGCASVLSSRNLVIYLVTVSAVCVAPLFYEASAARPDIAGLGVFVVILWMEGLLVVDFVERLRTQRRELYEAEQLAAAQAHADPLTGLGNHRALDLALKDWFTQRGSGDEMTVVFLDLNGFKSYNDSFGHTAGDALLRRLGHGLASHLGDKDVAFRLGGDEFCALLQGDLDRESTKVRGVADALREAGSGFSIDASIGVVAVPREATDGDSALRLADERMYAHKGAGRLGSAQEMSALLLRVVAEREPDLHEHAVDVVDLARRVARRLGCSAEELDLVVRAAEQHDVGKLAIPDSILSKPGPLNEEEWKVMRQHTVAAERILAGSASLREVGRLVRSTHEHWDGGGYPDGLASEEIPLGARIVGACDAYSAMRANRPYRRALTLEEAVAELQRGAGTQFDPHVVAMLEDEVRAGRPTRRLASR